METFELQEDARNVLERVLGQHIAPGQFIALPGGRLSPEAYKNVAQALNLCGVYRKPQGGFIVRDAGARDKLARLVEAGSIEDTSGLAHRLDTPPDLARFLVGQMAYQPGGASLTLEPSGGLGALVEPVKDVVGEHAVHVVERDGDRVEVLKRGRADKVVHADFLTIQAKRSPYDRILLSTLAFKDWGTHLFHALGFLSPGGLLGAAVPDNADGDRLYQFNAVGYHTCIVEVPGGLFKASTAPLRLMFVYRARPGERVIVAHGHEYKRGGAVTSDGVLTEGGSATAALAALLSRKYKLNVPHGGAKVASLSSALRDEGGVLYAFESYPGAPGDVTGAYFVILTRDGVSR